MTKREFLERVIEGLGYTKTSFCSACKISYKSFEKLCNNPRKMRINTVLKVVNFLHIRLDDFLKLDNVNQQ